MKHSTYTFISLLFISITVGNGQVKLVEEVADTSAGGVSCYKIITPSATYFLEQEGAGLSSMIDRDGNDWISFHKESSSGSAGEYRGFPNAVHQQDGSFFHPKNDGTEPSTTEVVYTGADRVTINALSGNGNWSGRWDFYPTHCTFTMTKMPDEYAYWILYEGTPGGDYDDDDWYFTSAIKSRTPLTINHENDIPGPEWIAFGDKNLKRALLLTHHEDDNHMDKFYQMNKQMTVFGFGREGLKKFLTSVPQSFSIGFVESDKYSKINKSAKAF